MFLTLHASVGALLGEMAPNPWLAFLYGLLSHFPLDMFPHGDRAMGKSARGSSRIVRRYIIMILVDATAALAIFVPSFWFGRFDRPWYAYLGALGGLIPDLIVAIPTYAMFVKKSERVLLRWFYWFHDFNHNNLVTAFDLPLRAGIAGQGVLLAFVLWKLW